MPRDVREALAPATSIEELRLPDEAIRTLRALGIDTAEQFLGAAQVANMELRPLLGDVFETALASAAGLAQMPGETLSDELAALPCALGAETELPAAVGETVPQLSLDREVGVCGPPLIVPTVPVRDQGSRGTCVAFAVTGALEYLLHCNGSTQDMSAQFSYWNCKHNDGAPTRPGTWISVASRLVQRNGVCPEIVWPYNPAPIPGNEPHDPVAAGAQRHALPYRIVARPIPATSVVDYKLALAGGKWAPFSVPVYNSWYLNPQVRLTGDLINPIPGETRVGGHAMCVVGCIDLPNRPELGGGRFILRNSWGTGWGRASPYGPGYGTIPYIYVQRFGMEACCLG